MRYQEILTEQKPPSRALALAVRAWSDDHGDSPATRQLKASKLLQALRARSRQFVTSYPMLYRGQVISKEQAEVLMHGGAIDLLLPMLSSWTVYSQIAADFAARRGLMTSKWAMCLAVPGSRLMAILDVPMVVDAADEMLPLDALLFDMSREGEVIVQHNGTLHIDLKDVIMIYEKTPSGILNHRGQHPI